MQLDFGQFLRAFGDTLRDPAGTAQLIVRQRIPHEVGWMGLAAVISLTVVALHVSNMVLGTTPEQMGLGLRPFFDVVFLGAMTVVMIFVLYFAGRAMGGNGTFGGTLLLMTWFQAIVLVLVVIQLIATFIAPGLGGIVALVAIGLQLYCLVHFLNELHGFQSLPKSAALFFVALIGIAFGLALIVTLIGGAAVMGGV